MNYAQIRADLDAAQLQAQAAHSHYHDLYRKGRATAYRHAELPRLHYDLQRAVTALVEYEQHMDPQSIASEGRLGEYLDYAAAQLGRRLASVGLEPSHPDTTAPPYGVAPDNLPPGVVRTAQLIIARLAPEWDPLDNWDNAILGPLIRTLCGALVDSPLLRAHDDQDTVERVAQAIHAETWRSISWDAIVPEAQQHYRDVARTALRTARESA